MNEGMRGKKQDEVDGKKCGLGNADNEKQWIKEREKGRAW